MRCPHPVGHPYVRSFFLMSIEPNSTTVISDLHFVLPQKLPPFLLGFDPVSEQHSFTCHGLQEPVAVLNLRSSSTWILNPVQAFNRRPFRDLHDLPVVIEQS